MSNDLSQKPSEENTEFAVADKWLQRVLAWASVPALILAVIFNRTYLAILCGLWLVTAFGYFFVKKSRGEKPLELGIGEVSKGAFPITPPPVTEQERLAPIDAQQILEALKKEYDIKKLEPNLVPVGSSVVSVHEGEHGVIIEGAPKDSYNYRAAIYVYHNKPHEKRRIGVLNDLSAEITYKFFDGSNSLWIHRGAWLSEKDNKVNLGKNDKRKLILATLEVANDVYAVERDFDGAHPEGFTRRVPLVTDLMSVHIRFITESEGTTVSEHDLMLEVVRKPFFTVKIRDLTLWKWHHLTDFLLEGYKLGTRIFEGEKEEDVVNEIKDWEARAATFIGQHLSEKQKTSFSNAHPSIDQGFKRERRIRVPLPRIPGKEPPKEAFQGPFYTLTDSIHARTKKLDEFQHQLSLSFMPKRRLDT